MTILGIVVGISGVPAVIIWTSLYIDSLMPWMKEYNSTLDSWTLLGAIALGIVWSVFATVGWKRGNVGLRIGLTLVIWAFVAAVVLEVLGRAMVRTA